MRSPLISIIITSYNRAATISQSIESALAQNYANIEVIISDNCSTDESDEVIRRYTNDPRVKYSRNGYNIGMVPNFKKAIYELANGEYFVIVNSDDYLINNNFISDAVSLISKYEDVFIVKGKFKLVSERTSKIKNCSFDLTGVYYTGQEWLANSTEINFAQIIEMLNWAGVFINRAEFMQLNIFEINAYNTDITSGILLLLKGNICFINEYSYAFRFLDNRIYYNTDTVENEYLELLKSVNYVSGHEYNKKYKADIKQFYKRFYHYVANYYMQLTYRNNRKQYFKLKDYLIVHNNDVVKAITKGRHWKLYSLAHYNITIGKLISNLKNRNS